MIDARESALYIVYCPHFVRTDSLRSFRLESQIIRYMGYAGRDCNIRILMI